MVNLIVKNEIILLLIMVGLVSGCIEQQVNVKEKSLLITIDDLQEYNIDYSEEYMGKFLKRDYGSNWEIKYEYDSPDKAGVSPIFLISRVEFEKNSKEAEDSFNQGIIAYKGGSLIGGATIEEKTNARNFGDNTYFAFLKKEDKIIGNIIVVRKKDKIFNLLLSGLYFEDDETLSELISPKLKLMDEYKP